MPDEQRCEVCNWLLATSAKEGCVPGNCAQRQVPTCHICGKNKGQPPERCNGHYGERYDEQLPPLSDDRIRELQDLTRNGPDVVAMAQEIERLRQREERMREALRFLLRRSRRVEAENAELRKDKARLDWIEKQVDEWRYHADFAIQQDEEDGVWFTRLTRHVSGELPQGIAYDDGKAETVRAAVDAALANEQLSTQEVRP